MKEKPEMGHHYLETRGPDLTLADRWIEANEKLEEVQQDIDRIVKKLVGRRGFVCCGMDTEKGYTLIVTLKKVPKDAARYEKLREAIGEATGFDYVELVDY